MTRKAVMAGMLAVVVAASTGFAADYSRYSNEELAGMRGTMRQHSMEDRQAFSNEWQKRMRAMSPEERREYMGGPRGSGREEMQQRREMMRERQSMHERGAGTHGRGGMGGGRR